MRTSERTAAATAEANVADGQQRGQRAQHSNAAPPRQATPNKGEHPCPPRQRVVSAGPIETALLDRQAPDGAANHTRPTKSKSTPTQVAIATDTPPQTLVTAGNLRDGAATAASAAAPVWLTGARRAPRSGRWTSRARAHLEHPTPRVRTSIPTRPKGWAWDGDPAQRGRPQALSGPATHG